MGFLWDVRELARSERWSEDWVPCVPGESDPLESSGGQLGRPVALAICMRPNFRSTSQVSHLKLAVLKIGK